MYREIVRFLFNLTRSEREKNSAHLSRVTEKIRKFNIFYNVLQ